MSKFLARIRKWLCWHNFQYRGFRVADDEYRNMRYSERKYICKKCGKEIWVDARYKNTGEPHKPIIGWFMI